jgi:hypothetical protein
LRSIGLNFKIPADPYLRAVYENQERLREGGQVAITRATRLEEIGVAGPLLERAWSFVRELRCSAATVGPASGLAITTIARLGVHQLRPG